MKLLCKLAGMAAVILLAAAAASAQCADQNIAPSNTRAAIKAIRAINTAEAASLQFNHHYLDLQQLGQDKALAPVFQRYSSTHLAFDPKGDVVPGFKAELVVSSDGSQYLLKVFSSASRCPGAFESDQTGLIYVAQALH